MTTTCDECRFQTLRCAINGEIREGSYCVLFVYMNDEKPELCITAVTRCGIKEERAEEPRESFENDA